MSGVEFPGFDSLFAFSDPLATRPLRGSFSGDLTIGRGKRIPHPTSLLRGEEMASDVLVASRHSGGRTPGDVVWTASGNVVLLSERLTQILQVASVSGWSSLPATVEAPEGPVPYGFLVVTGRCGPLDRGRSSREWGVYPGGRVARSRGLYFDEESWDGSDFFMEAGRTGWKFVTRRVVNLFRTNRIRNVAFERLDEVEFPHRD